MGPPANCGTHRVNCRQTISLTIIRQNCVPYSWNLVFFTCSDPVLITPGSSNEFPWISIWRLVKPHADYCVDIQNARWLRPVFTESYRLLRVASGERTCDCLCLKCTWSKCKSYTAGKGFVYYIRGRQPFLHCGPV